MLCLCSCESGANSSTESAPIHCSMDIARRIACILQRWLSQQYCRLLKCCHTNTATATDASQSHSSICANKVIANPALAAISTSTTLQVLRHGPEQGRQVSPCSYMRLDVPLDCTGPLRLPVSDEVDSAAAQPAWCCRDALQLHAPGCAPGLQGTPAPIGKCLLTWDCLEQGCGAASLVQSLCP